MLIYYFNFCLLVLTSHNSPVSPVRFVTAVTEAMDALRGLTIKLGTADVGLFLS